MEQQLLQEKILESLSKITEKLDALEKKSATVANAPHRSDQLNELFSALAKSQAEMRTAGLSAENPYFKSRYADLTEIVKASRPFLSRNGLCVIQQILPNDDGQNLLHTLLAHSSGQWIESRMRILPAKNDIQSLGSYITYLRRYAYAALIGVVATSEDDDGEAAVATERALYAKGIAINTNYNPKEQSYEPITKEQLEELEYELSEYTDIAEMILDALKIQSLADLPKSKFLSAIKRVREIKQTRSGK